MITQQDWLSAAPELTAGKFLQQKVETFSRTMDLNYMGVVHVLKAVLPGMVEQRQGHIVVISSVMAIIGILTYYSSHGHNDARWC